MQGTHEGMTKPKMEQIKRPAETEGKCSACGKTAVLGDGLCQKCWDDKCDRLDSHRALAGRIKWICAMAKQGISTDDIATRLNVSRRTVQRYLQEQRT
jgi:DNA-binding NarL/FixJ family response regulator